MISKIQQCSSLGLCPTFPSPNLLYDLTFGWLISCQVPSGGRQRQISLARERKGDGGTNCSWWLGEITTGMWNQRKNRVPTRPQRCWDRFEYSEEFWGPRKIFSFSQVSVKDNQQTCFFHGNWYMVGSQPGPTVPSWASTQTAWFCWLSSNLT